jgi:hypothetical protein
LATPVSLWDESIEAGTHSVEIDALQTNNTGEAMKKSGMRRAGAFCSVVVVGTFMLSSRLPAEESLGSACILEVGICERIPVGEICLPELGCTTFPDIEIIGTKVVE